jgi:hypothetical protein
VDIQVCKFINRIGLSCHCGQSRHIIPKPTGVLVSQQLYNDKFSKILLLFFEKNDWDDGHTIKFYQKILSKTG